MPEPHHQRRLTAREGTALVRVWHRRRAAESQAAFCRRRKIGPWILRYWLNRTVPQVHPGFVQVTAVPQCAPFLEVSIGGAQIRLRHDFDPALLRAVAACLTVGEAAC